MFVSNLTQFLHFNFYSWLSRLMLFISKQQFSHDCHYCCFNFSLCLIWVKYAIFYFSSASSSLFLPTLFKHCILKALIHSVSDDHLVLNKVFKDEICFQSPLDNVCHLHIWKKLGRQRMGNRWKLKLEQSHIHKMQWSRIHLPLSQSVSVFMSLMPTRRTTKSLFLFLTAGDCSWLTPARTNAKTRL